MGGLLGEEPEEGRIIGEGQEEAGGLRRRVRKRRGRRRECQGGSGGGGGGKVDGEAWSSSLQTLADQQCPPLCLIVLMSLRSKRPQLGVQRTLTRICRDCITSWFGASLPALGDFSFPKCDMKSSACLPPLSLWDC